MTFDPNQPYKNVDGVNINLTPNEIADQQAMAIVATAQVPLVSIQQQIAAFEAQQTPDVIRNAILGDAASISTLQYIQTQIAVLQGELPALQLTLASAVSQQAVVLKQTGQLS